MLFKVVALSMSIVVLGWSGLKAQDTVELNNNWKMHASEDFKDPGTTISNPAYVLKGWENAVVPGTVLTSKLANKKIPDPFWGMNNNQIPDIYTIGRAYYTYWFTTDIAVAKPVGNGQVWLNFRGVNDSFDLYLNGKKINSHPEKGMLLRKKYNITPILAANGKNRLAMIVYPPDPVGNANGGQGGDGQIAKNVGLQYTAGWDWIRPIRDRNTGIWDKVYLEKTGAVDVKYPHIVTLVPGKRKPSGPQSPATIKVSADLFNATGETVRGTLKFLIAGQSIAVQVALDAHETKTVALPDLLLQNPRLWWPNNYGEPYLYDAVLTFEANGSVSDSEKAKVGIRELQSDWNSHTKSREIFVNGQPVFIKGGNWIISDAMLRFSKKRYDAEIRFHRDMNLNLIRIWGGAITERPEFYDACDRYGLLVMQDFWVSGDCNGRWEDPLKLDDQWIRRQYPDDHGLFLQSAADMIKMIRNHASLAIWCGGNEITPPEDILLPLRDSILPSLDGTRWFVDYSNSNEMSFNAIGGNGDGPYGIQDIHHFWDERTYPFNTEVGSVGVGDITSLKRFLPNESLVPPQLLIGLGGTTKEKADSIWEYHTYIGYGNHIKPYGDATGLEDWANKAQLVNYDQYRALMEGFSSHMWDWYTGAIIWKTQNPWTAMRGQMYDYYLDPNACLYGLRNGSAPLHAMYHPTDGMISIINNGFEKQNDLMLQVNAYTMRGEEMTLTQVFCYLEPSTIKPILSVKQAIDTLSAKEGLFLELQILNKNKEVLNSNLYWLPDARGQYSGLQKMVRTPIQIQAKSVANGEIDLSINSATDRPLAFFNRISLLDGKTGERILPAFYSDNYVSVPPGGKKKIRISFDPDLNTSGFKVSVKGWNVAEHVVNVE
ncbi:Glycosyl hydrolases family 2, TIM barrel domain [bacterium A37T11]|nr:Glycosyl hydrolases family 2, TIM barrel domain [bacterium A37T11]